MKIYIMVSDDIIFKPRVLYQILENKAKNVCGVAEVGYRKTKRNKPTNRNSVLGHQGFSHFEVL